MWKIRVRATVFKESIYIPTVILYGKIMHMVHVGGLKPQRDERYLTASLQWGGGLRGDRAPVRSISTYISVLVSAAWVTWIPLNPARLPHPCSTRGSLVTQTPPPTQVTPCRWRVTRGRAVPGHTQPTIPGTPGPSHHTHQLGHSIPTSCRPESAQQPARDLLRSSRDRADAPSTTERVMTDIPHHQGKGHSPDHSAATAPSLLAWLAGSNPGIVLQANRILKAGTHLSPMSMLFHSRAASIVFAYSQSPSLPHLNWLPFYKEKAQF